MAAPNSTTETITGTVESVNERGVRIAGAWYNLSKFHPVALPMRGALVALEVEGGRWIQRCDVLEAQDAPSGSQRAVAAPGARERTITRLAVLKAAVTLAAGKGDVTSADVLKVAERFEAWVTRDGEAEA
jgi:hypothetical protein